MFCILEINFDICIRKLNNQTNKEMATYSLMKGFSKVGEFNSILEAKKVAEQNGSGVYNLIEKSDSPNKYKDSWRQN